MKGRSSTTLRVLRVLAIALGVAIVGILFIIIFWRSAPAPLVTLSFPENTTGTPPTSAVFSFDGSIAVTLPQEGTIVTPPAGIEGQAQGNWFNEGVFPIEILDGNGTILGQGTALALGNWMTTDTVPFAANVPFKTPHYATGTILFMSDNPSGLSENAKQFSLPIRFK
jgi:hypothetical protein